MKLHSYLAAADFAFDILGNIVIREHSETIILTWTHFIQRHIAEKRLVEIDKYFVSA